MSEIALHREHTLGLARAREIAWQWAEDAEEKFAVQCTVEEGEDCDLVHFTRAGVKGTLTVAADHFALNARLGFLLSAFAQTIQTEVEKNLDSLLALEARKPARRKKAAAPAKQAAARKK